MDPGQPLNPYLPAPRDFNRNRLVHGSPDSSEWEEAPVLSVNYDFYVNLTTFALQPARPRRDDARTPQPDDMGLSLSVAGPIQGVFSIGIV